MCRSWCFIFLLSVVAIIINSANIQSADAVELGWRNNGNTDTSSETTPLLSKESLDSTESTDTTSKPVRNRAGYSRIYPMNAKKEPSEKTPLFSKDSLDSAESTDTTSKPKLVRGKGSSVRTFRPRPELQQESTASKPELPKPELPKPELPKPALPKPKLPTPNLPMPTLPNKEIAATSMVDHGPDLSSEGSETGEKTPEEIEKERRAQFRQECFGECRSKDGYIQVPGDLVAIGDKIPILTGKITDRGKGMKPKCNCMINSALTWFLNEREKGKGDEFEQKYKRDRKWARELLEEQGFKVHYPPTKPTKLQRSPMVKRILDDEEEEPPSSPGNEGCHEKCQRENGYISSGIGTVHIAIGVIDDTSGYKEICKCRVNIGLKQILDANDFSAFQSVFENNPRDTNNWSAWLLRRKHTVHWDSQKGQKAPQEDQKSPLGGLKGPSGGQKSPQGRS